MSVDPEDPENIISLDNGGVKQEPQPETKTKHPKEARALFGVSMTEEGEGRRMPLFNYTGQTVCVYIYEFIILFI